MRAVTARRPEQAAERLADLAVRLGPCCAEAVDVLEVAARLEAEGVNDTLAVERYGHRDVFALAERLYHGSVPRTRPRPGTAAAWRSTGRHHLLRGVLFGLPGLLYARRERPHRDRTSGGDRRDHRVAARGVGAERGTVVPRLRPARSRSTGPEPSEAAALPGARMCSC